MREPVPLRQKEEIDAGGAWPAAQAPELRGHLPFVMGAAGIVIRAGRPRLCFVFKILKSVSPSPTRAIERFQDHRSGAIRVFAGFY